MRPKTLRGWSDVDSAVEPADPHAEIRRNKYDFEDEPEDSIPSPWSIADWRQGAANISVVNAPRNQPREKVFGAFEVEQQEQVAPSLSTHSIYHGLSLLMLLLSGFLVCVIAVLVML